MKTLKDLFLDELADIYDAEQRIAKALPKLAKAAMSPDLKKAIQAHLKETEGHAKKVELVFRAFDEKPKAIKCEAAVGLLKEGSGIAAEFKGSPALDAALISAAQKVEHYEMASYGCLREWAGLLENEKAAGLLQEILDEEEAANHKLNELAHAGINEEAMGDSAPGNGRNHSSMARRNGGAAAMSGASASPSKDRMRSRLSSKSKAGKVGWALLWLMGIPIPILVIAFLLRGCT